ncbi:UDP-glucuronosyltransferase 2B18 [Papilio machaon]|uniref:UDP-glucuronosyltransferase 2B18 n=1 Tax=Papilio machaon TaxID=76193 RepID=A0A194RCG4_PAPMA|nr:UDP-glucuronosyltransferase 2B18 [Papilio machaon]
MSAGEPLIGIEMLGEQWNSSDKSIHPIHDKIDTKPDTNTLIEEKFDTALKTLLNDKRYRKNIVMLRQMMCERTQKPLDRAIWWMESVIRNGGARHLAPSTANIFGAQYLQSQTVFVSLTYVKEDQEGEEHLGSKIFANGTTKVRDLYFELPCRVQSSSYYDNRQPSLGDGIKRCRI